MAFFFFFNDTATTEIYTFPYTTLFRSPLCISTGGNSGTQAATLVTRAMALGHADRKSTRLNSSHTVISYAVFCLKKKKKHARTVSHAEDFDKIFADSIVKILEEDRVTR